MSHQYDLLYIFVFIFIMINRIIHEYKHTCSIAYFLNISYYFWMIKWKKDYEQFSNSESSAPALLFP